MGSAAENTLDASADASTSDAGPKRQVNTAPKAEQSPPESPPLSCDTNRPKVIMTSPAGEQIGGYASSCISCMNDKGEGVSQCADGPTLTEGFSIIHPGDEVTFSMPEGTIMAGPRCTPACPPQIRISSLQCPSAAASIIEISEDIPTKLDLAPGHYLATFSTYFEQGKKSGSMSAGFGLIVDPKAERKLVHDRPDTDNPAQCPTDKDAG